MAYQSDTVAAVVNRLNIQYFLPAIQREFVWQPDQVIQLFDSILRGYPISSFLFWELKAENRDNWEIYKFIENYQQGGTHNELASTVGVHQLVLVLDGQQRLTSLFIGLKGTYKIKTPKMRWDNPHAWTKQKLFLDLLHDPRSDAEEAETGNHYRLIFAKDAPRNDAKHHWFQVGRILDFDSEQDFTDFLYAERDRLHDDVTRRQTTVFESNLRRLYQAIWKDGIIAYYIEHDQDYDRVLDIFVRANEGGTKLSKSDLLLSMITLKWSDMNAREEIYGCVDRINNELTRKNNFDKDFIMKICLVASDLPVAYKVGNFTQQNLQSIQHKWDKIKVAVEMGVDLVNTFGIDRDTLTSNNALIPIIYYFYKNPGMNLRGSSSSDLSNATAIRRFLSISLLNNVFGRAADNLQQTTRRVLQENLALSSDFPLTALFDEIARVSRSPYLDDYSLDNILGFKYGKQITFLALSLLYDDNAWGTMTFHQDHIFPQSLFTIRSMTAAGIPAADHVRYSEACNDLANLELLISAENISKSNASFETWLTTRDATFCQRHLIPTDPALLKFDRFLDFVEARQELIRQRLKHLFTSHSGPSSPQP